MKYPRVFAVIALAASGFQAVAQTLPTAPEAGCPTAGVVEAGHGMVLFGTDNLYASHIPVFHGPDTPGDRMVHCWQAFFEVELSHPDQDAKALYLDNAFENGAQRLMTLAPDAFKLPDLLDGNLSSFVAEIHKGNFEASDAKRLLSGVTVKPVQKRHSGLNRKTKPLESLTYLHIGPPAGKEDDGNAYLAHEISAPDNFDHIVQIKWIRKDPTYLGGDVFRAPIFFRGREAKDAPVADTVQNRLKPGQTYDVFITRAGLAAAPSDSKPEEGESTFTVTGDFYCLTGPGFFAPDNPCP